MSRGKCHNLWQYKTVLKNMLLVTSYTLRGRFRSLENPHSHHDGPRFYSTTHLVSKAPEPFENTDFLKEQIESKIQEKLSRVSKLTTFSASRTPPLTNAESRVPTLCDWVLDLSDLERVEDGTFDILRYKNNCRTHIKFKTTREEKQARKSANVY